MITIHRATTYQMVVTETKRRAREDACERIIYEVDGLIKIRLVGEDKSSGQTTLCIVNHDGRVTELER